MYSWKELHVLDRVTAPLVVAEQLLSLSQRVPLRAPFPGLDGPHLRRWSEGFLVGLFQVLLN